MKLKLFARKVAVGLIAVGSLACLATDTFAANRTWTSSTVTTANRNKWGTAWATNWAGQLLPGSGDVAVFGSNALAVYNPQVQEATTVGGVRFNTSPTSYNIGGAALTIGSDGVNNQAGRNARLNLPVLGANQTWSGGSGASITANNLDVKGKNLGLSTDVTIQTLNQTGLTSSLITVAGGNSFVAGGGPSGDVNFAVSSGFLATYDADQGAGYASNESNLDISGSGTYNNAVVSGGSQIGLTVWNDVTMSGGALDMMGANASLTANSYVQTGGTVRHYVGGVSGAPEFSTISSVEPFQYGGELRIDFSGAGANAFPIGTAWNLFQGTNPGGDAASNFATAVLAGVDGSSPYAGLSFTKYGTEFSTPKGTDGTYLVFQAQNGNLVVVPEPSTIVFAGLGVAMSGWTMWKKRRLSKLLAANVG
jgi:hypothetical protein